MRKEGGGCHASWERPCFEEQRIMPHGAAKEERHLGTNASFKFKTRSYGYQTLYVRKKRDKKKKKNEAVTAQMMQWVPC